MGTLLSNASCCYYRKVSSTSNVSNPEVDEGSRVLARPEEVSLTVVWSCWAGQGRFWALRTRSLPAFILRHFWNTPVCAGEKRRRRTLRLKRRRVTLVQCPRPQSHCQGLRTGDAEEALSFLTDSHSICPRYFPPSPVKSHFYGV